VISPIFRYTWEGYNNEPTDLKSVGISSSGHFSILDEIYRRTNQY